MVRVVSAVRSLTALSEESLRLSIVTNTEGFIQRETQIPYDHVNLCLPGTRSHILSSSTRHRKKRGNR